MAQEKTKYTPLAAVLFGLGLAFAVIFLTVCAALVGNHLKIFGPTYTVEEIYDEHSPTRRGYHVRKDGWSQLYTRDKGVAEDALRFYQSKEK